MKGLSARPVMRLLCFLLFLSIAALLPAQCPDCCNGIMDCSETGVDCGGPDCQPCNSLIPNGGFECITSCPTDEQQIALATPWAALHATGTPDLFNACFTFGPVWNVDVPANSWGTQAANGGDGYAGVLSVNDFFSDDKRDYLQVPLTAALTPGTNYDISYYLSMADTYQWAIDGFGAYFSVGPLVVPDNLPLSFHGVAPHITSPAGPANVLNDKTNWVLISGTYTAAGGETHVVIGNFKSNAFPIVSNVGGARPQGYYFIDDAATVPSGSLPVKMLEFEGRYRMDAVDLNWVTASEENSARFDVERSRDGMFFDKVGEVSAAGFSSSDRDYHWTDTNPLRGISYYRLRQVDVNGRNANSEVVEITGESLFDVKGIILSPDHEFLRFEVFQPIGNSVLVDIVTLDGRVLRRERVDAAAGRYETGFLPVGDLPSAMYLLRISNGKDQFTRKFLIRR